jgi:hypothetical protein
MVRSCSKLDQVPHTDGRNQEAFDGGLFALRIASTSIPFKSQALALDEAPRALALLNLAD